MRLWWLVLVAGCKGLSGEAVRDFIPGVYVRDFATEFAVGSDTLEVQWQGENTYVIQKRSGFHRVLKGKLQAKETREEKWMTLWDTEKGVLNEVKKGKVLSFDLEKKQLLVGASVYQKIP